MDLLLWRHAEAEATSPDPARELTQRGREQARKMAGWLREHAPAELRILVSPTLRTQQTARALSAHFETVPELAPEGNATQLIRIAGWPNAAHAVLVVGHQPTLGKAAALLLSGREDEWSVKKGAIWWLQSRQRHGASETVVRAVLPVSLI